MTKSLNIGIAGLGTVGAGTLKLLRENAALIAARCGRSIEVVAVSMRDAAKKREVSLDGLRVERDALALSSASDIDVVVELIGGHEGVARQLVETAIANGKHVVTANKALIAHHGKMLAAQAETAKVMLAFEAAVAGGIPIIAALRGGLAANRIAKVAGILNGTCNYILTRMEHDKLDLDVVMQEASKLGYLEADPSLDIDGIDAAHKLSILAALAFGVAPDLAHVHSDGIRTVSLRDIEYAAEFGYRIKLLGIASMEDGKLLQRVHPCLVPLDAPLAAVDGAFNAVEVTGDAVGRVVFEGRGAGAGPTASAVVSDLMAIARGDRYAPFNVSAGALMEAKAAPFSAHRGSYYMRLSMKDQPGVLADFTRVFAAQQISVHSITQRAVLSDHTAQIIVITYDTSEEAVSKAAAAIAALSSSLAAPVVLRIET
jgi:homoserine dehydrogenase